MKRPKILYAYDLHMSLNKHSVGADCITTISYSSSDGVRWRCRGEDHDFYGYATLREAKLEEIKQTRLEIGARENWLKKLLKETKKNA